MNEKKFKVGDKVRFAYDPRHAGYINAAYGVFGNTLYDIESESGYIHRRVPESAIEPWESPDALVSRVNVVKKTDGSYDIENLSENEFRIICVALENSCGMTCREYIGLFENLYESYKYYTAKEL